jgi:hypothetical protein
MIAPVKLLTASRNRGFNSSTAWRCIAALLDIFFPVNLSLFAEVSCGGCES